MFIQRNIPGCSWIGGSHLLIMISGLWKMLKRMTSDSIESMETKRRVCCEHKIQQAFIDEIRVHILHETITRCFKFTKAVDFRHRSQFLSGSAPSKDGTWVLNATTSSLRSVLDTLTCEDGVQ